MKIIIISLLTLLCFYNSPSFANQQCDSPKTKTEINHCSKIEFESAEQRMYNTYERIINFAKSDEVFISKLKQSQKSWEESRDADLEAIFPRDDKIGNYGSLYNAIYYSQKSSITARREVFLLELIENIVKK